MKRVYDLEAKLRDLGIERQKVKKNKKNRKITLLFS